MFMKQVEPHREVPGTDLSLTTAIMENPTSPRGADDGGGKTFPRDIIYARNVADQSSPSISQNQYRPHAAAVRRNRHPPFLRLKP
ncbi:hypothetical protein ON010_g13877 [Phytophthora cinnamomi]|nr:hypothetical protein ON010_g13877 [Phytophthora cinnamomi]